MPRFKKTKFRKRRFRANLNMRRPPRRRRPRKGKRPRRRLGSTLAKVVHGSTWLDVANILPACVLNTATPPAGDLLATFTQMTVVPNKIKELSARAGIYKQFRIDKIVYEFSRADRIRATSAALAYVDYFGANYSFCFPNTFNQTLPDIATSGANNGEVLAWCNQQSRVTRVPLHRNKFKKTVRAMVVKKVELGGMGTSPGAEINTPVRCPWMDLHVDIDDAISFGQITFCQPAVNATSLYTIGSAGNPGVTSRSVADSIGYNCRAKVFWSCKGRFLNAALV